MNFYRQQKSRLSAKTHSQKSKKASQNQFEKSPHNLSSKPHSSLITFFSISSASTSIGQVLMSNESSQLYRAPINFQTLPLTAQNAIFVYPIFSLPSGQKFYLFRQIRWVDGVVVRSNFHDYVQTFTPRPILTLNKAFLRPGRRFIRNYLDCFWATVRDRVGKSQNFELW